VSYEGFISFPGIEEPQYIITATRSVGLRPNKCLLVTKPQDTLPSLHGDFTFGFDSTTITWKNALCDSALMKVSRDGQRAIWTIKDGRWLIWKSFIHGAYNIPMPDGKIDPDTRKTLAELCDLLFQAMNVTGDTSNVTSVEYPEVVWDHDRTVLEMEELLDGRGYVVSYLLDGTYKIFSVGSGQTIPNDTDVINFSASVNPPEYPEILRALGAKTRVQSKLKMTPVGLDKDGKWKKVNDLSYNPQGAGVSGGWDNLAPGPFQMITDPLDNELARRTVFSCYQVEFQADGTHNISAGSVNYCPGEIVVTSPLQYLPLSRDLVETAKDVFGKERNGEAYVEGTFYLEYSSGSSRKTGAGVIAKNTSKFFRMERTDWTLDEENGIITFREPVQMSVKVDRGEGLKDEMTFADVFFVCAYSIHDNDLRIKDRYIRDRTLGGVGADQLRREELERTLICKYNALLNTGIESITDNETTVDIYADSVLDNAYASYSTGIGTLVHYRGIRSFNTDGINLQVAWTCAKPGSPAPFSTMVSQNMEAHPLIPTTRSRRDKRQIERVNQWNSSRGRRYRNSKRGKGKKS